jgi:intracellular sulfur oxidation DsrE/DsrF family protein
MAKRDLDRDPKAKIEIVAYGDGVQFLQSDTLFSSQGPKVTELTGRGVVFKVCADSMRFHNLTPADFLPKVQVVPSGSLEIARLQRQGYSYLRP